jgi:hypothetical protein
MKDRMVTSLILSAAWATLEDWADARQTEVDCLLLNVRSLDATKCGHS